jgi:transporter family protein
MAGEGGMDSIFAANLIWLSAGIVGVVFLAYGLYTGSFQEGIRNNSVKMLALPILAGVFLALGMYTIKRAVTLGDAGPSVAIANSNAIIVAALAWLVLGEELSATKIGGMAMVIGGIIVMSVL